MAQNASLKGVPAAYSKKTSGNKDLTNVDVLQEYFDKARILLCVFHALKYFKTEIHVLRIPLTTRINIMKNIRRLIYDNDQISTLYLREIKNNSEGTDSYEYFQVNWLSCGTQNIAKVYLTLIQMSITISEHLN